MRRITLFAGLACVFASKKTIRPKSLGGDGQLKDRLRAKAKGWLREAKAAVSSDFEAALLKATRPDMAAPKPKHVESVALSVAAFEAYRSPDCDPYGSLLHKVWSRLHEADARTVCKACYVLHRLLSAPRAGGAVEFAGLAAAYAMLAQRSSAKTDTRYFDERPVLRLQSQKDADYDVRKWRKFVAAYWAFVDGCWRSAAAGPPATPRAAAAAAAAASALAARAALAFPDYPRANDLVASVARRLAADLDAYAAAFVVAAVAWRRPGSFSWQLAGDVAPRRRKSKRKKNRKP